LYFGYLFIRPEKTSAALLFGDEFHQ